VDHLRKLFVIIAHHIILTGYGHWLPNDPRGSMSRQIRTGNLRALGGGHYGRRQDQPRREDLRAFRRNASTRLAHTLLWFDAPQRQAIGEAFGAVIAAERLTCYACVVLRNHAHLVTRRHRLQAEEMISLLRERSRQLLSRRGPLPAYHPLWSSDPYVAFKDTPQAVSAAIRYIQSHFAKHNIEPQNWDFAVPYDNWPFHKKPRR
jgi:hypothetical protein